MRRRRSKSFLPNQRRRISGDVDSPTQYGTTLLSPADALTSPQFLLVKGVVSFTDDYTFAPGSEVVFLDNDSGFRVTQGVLLSLESSHLHGCTKLWKGVEVLEGGTLSANDCTFEDAKAAIILRRLTTIEAVGNTFSKNVCGILATVEFPIDVEMPVTLLPGGISGNTFDGADLLLETIDPSEIDPGVENAVLANITGDRPFVGIWLRGVSAITIGHLGELFDGTNDVPLNVFQNYGYDNGGCTTGSTGYMGILSTRSNLEVRNSIFSNIGYYNPMDGSQNCGATAIFARNYSSKINPKTTVIGTKGANTDLYTFSNCITDISTVGTSLEVTNVTSYKALTSISFAMQSSGQNAIDVNIEDNDITYFRGIGIEGKWFKPIDVKVKNNLISDNDELYDPSSRVGIIMHGHNWAGKPGSGIIGNTIVSNSILFFGAFHGIILDKCPNMFVYDNTIEEVNSTESNLASFFGILNLGINPSNGMIITANTINGAKIDYPFPSAGIRLAECSNTWLSCNITNNINTGMLFLGDCDNSVLHKNEFGYNNKGLALGDPDLDFVYNVIGLQLIKENAWYIPTSPIHAYALNEISAASSVFKIHESDVGSIYWPEIRKIGDNDDMGTWFQTTQVGLPYDTDCSGNPKPPSEKDKLGDSDNKIIEGTYTPALDYPALAWEARWLLADKLNRTPELMEEAIEVTQYFQDTYNDSYSYLNRIYQTYRNIWQQETPVLVQAANLEEQLKSYVAQRLELNRQLTANPVENETLYEQMAGLDVAIENTINSLSEAMSELNTEVDQAINDLLIALEPVNTSTEYEQDMKAVIRTMLQLHFSSEALTPEQSAEMLNIANKCRYSGGYAVALARGFFEPIDSYEQDLDCRPAENFGNFNAYQSSTFNFNIYPNPTQSVLILEVNEKFEEGNVKIYNYIGVPLKNVNFSENKIHLSVADLLAGIYFIEVETDEQKAYRRTFIKVD